MICFNFLAKAKKKFRPKKKKARCAQQCADSTLSVLEIFTTRAKQKIMEKVENYITTYMDYVYDIAKYANTVIRLVSNWRTTPFRFGEPSGAHISADEDYQEGRV